MPERATNKSAEALVVGMAPDVCLTPMGSSMVPVAYTITSKFDVAEKTAPKVNYCGLPAFTMASRLPRVMGDEAGTGGGIISHVNRGYCRPVEHSGTVRAHGKHVVRHGDLMHMNCNGPEGPANTYGRIVYIGAGAAGEVGRETLYKKSTVTVDNKTGKTTVEEREVTRDSKTGATTEARQRTEIDPKTGEIKTQRESITTGPEGERSYEASTGHFDPAKQRYDWTTQSKALPSQSPAVAIADNHPEIMADPDYQAAMKEQAAAQAEIDAANKEIAWEAAKAAVDVAGLIDPTPISDTVGAVMALSDRDFWGAGLSIVSWIPYLGDAVAKPMKGTRAAAKIAKLMDKLAGLKGKLKKLQDLAEAAKKRIKDLLAKGKKGDLPDPPKKPGDGGNVLKPKIRYDAKNLPHNPDDLVNKGGWKEVTDPRMAANSSRREFVDPQTGQKIAFDKGKPGATGFEGKDHYHMYNPNSTGKGDFYLDINGNPVPKNNPASHILPPTK